jgi:hypothetical protein
VGPDVASANGQRLEFGAVRAHEHLASPIQLILSAVGGMELALASPCDVLQYLVLNSPIDSVPLAAMTESHPARQRASSPAGQFPLWFSAQEEDCTEQPSSGATAASGGRGGRKRPDW